MSKLFYHVMQDNTGNLLFDVSGTMRIAGSGTLATIYGDEALTVILPNPMTNHPSFGSFKCFLGVGDYDFHMAKAGYTFETLTGVQGSGTMADQNASNVSITGGSAINLGALSTVGAAAEAYFSGPTRVEGHLSVATAPVGGAAMSLYYGGKHGVFLRPGVDTGTYWAIGFQNVAGTPVGTIVTSATATAYNTSSDARLKEEVETLDGALEVVRALRPVEFRWKLDGTRGQGFLAQEALAVVPQAVTGLPDSVEPTMQMDLSKLVPHLVGAVKELAQQVQALTARLEAAGA